ncbi:hypothetical protein PS850_06193 [Pseudomonas fluorescens]|nr:hypothetical protein PS850_06193 [Pseudomonas fluorescens]
MREPYADKSSVIDGEVSSTAISADQYTDSPSIIGERRLTAAEFQGLTAVPAAVEWFATSPDGQ